MNLVMEFGKGCNFVIHDPIKSIWDHNFKCQNRSSVTVNGLNKILKSKYVVRLEIWIN